MAMAMTMTMTMRMRRLPLLTMIGANVNPGFLEHPRTLPSQPMCLARTSGHFSPLQKL
ncbi:hypothetical protein BofuT4_uP114110.1 [Botrytis cinerea T4]|uniref:Uncharacterized protein n=1 Tax=Botryotinia fuckeliana (strain T4) TaxID=999810 RepID=G2Y5G7_BOTF4|nr:hypothetical protein BofuT4_uP114110.1 [Botrytis cinerea T4]